MTSAKEKYIFILASLALSAGAAFFFLRGAPAAFPVDDAYIHLCYARSLADGAGFSFNAGEPSFGTSSPLWVMLLALFVRSLDSTLLIRALSWAALWTILAFSALIISQSLRPGLGPARKTTFERYFFPLMAAALLAASGNFLWITFSGMESGLWVALALAAVYFLVRKNPSWAGYPVLGLTALCRMETAFLLVIVFLWQLLNVKDKRKVLAGFAITLAIAASFYVYAHFRLGTFSPTTRAGKLASDLFNAGLSLRGGFAFLQRHIAYLRLTQPGALVALGLALLGLALWAVSPRRAQVGPAGVTAFFALAIFLYHDQFFRSTAAITPFHNFRYQVFFFPALALGLARIFGEAYSALNSRPARAMTVIILLALPGFYRLAPWHDLYLGQCAHVRDVHIKAGEWCKTSLPEKARIACFDIGALKFFSDRYVIDLGGLVDPLAHPYLRQRAVGPYLQKMSATHYAELGTPGSERLLGVKKDAGKLYQLVPLAYFPGKRMREPVLLHSWEMKIFELKWLETPK